MKINKLAVITALMCCAASQLCSAQIVVSGGSASQGSASPVNYRKQLEDPFATPVGSADQSASSPQPLSLDEPAVAEVDDSSALDDSSSRSIVDEAPALTNPFSQLGNQPQPPNEGSPVHSPAEGQFTQPVEKGVPVSRNVGSNSRSMTETIIQYGSMDGIADAATMPINWPSSSPLYRTNPIGHTMLQNWCVQGLWYNYPAQRAAECVRIQQQIARGSCNACNRYTMVDSGCNQCAVPDHGSVIPGNVPTVLCDNCVAQHAPTSRAIPSVPVVTQMQQPAVPVQVRVPNPPVKSRPVIAQQPYGYPDRQYR